MPKSDSRENRAGRTSNDATIVAEAPEPGSTWETGQKEQGAQGGTGIERKQILTLLVLSLSLAIIVLDATIVIVALKTISIDFSISLKDLEWITSLYALVFGSFILTWGKLSDEFGRRRIFAAGISLFVLGSIIDGVSSNLTQMLVGRVIQGFGAAMAAPATLAILTTTFTGKSRNIAFGIWGATAGAAAVLGPLLGGYFTSDPTFTWRWAFLINVPIGAVALIGAAFVIRESRFKDPKYTTDFGGLALITLGLSALLFGQSWPFTSFSLPAFSIVSGAVLLAAFTYYDIRRARKGRVPLFDFSLLRFPVFRFAPIAGALANRFGPRWVVTMGMTLEAVALFSIFAITAVPTPVYDYYPVLVVYGAGVGLAISQLTSVVLMSIPWQKAGVGSGANNTVRQVGSAFGIAVIGAVLVAIISSVGQADVAASSLPATLKATLDQVLSGGLSGGVGQVPPGLEGTPLAATIQGVFNDAITQGTRWAAFTAAIFVSFGALSSLLIPNPRAKTMAKTKTIPVQQPTIIDRRVGALMTAEFVAIVGLLVAISWDYQQNVFMQQWFTSNAAPIGYLLNNYVGSILVTILGAALIGWRIVSQRRGSRRPDPNT